MSPHSAQALAATFPDSQSTNPALEHSPTALGLVSREKKNGDILNVASHTVSLFSLRCHLLRVQKSLVDQSTPGKLWVC